MSDDVNAEAEAVEETITDVVAAEAEKGGENAEDKTKTAPEAEAPEDGKVEGEKEDSPKTDEKPKAESGDFTPFESEDIKLPEGLEVDNELSEGFLAFANEHKLSSEQFEGLVKLQTEAMQRASEKASEAWNNYQDGMEKEVKEDSDVGGEKLEGVMSSIGKLLNSYPGGEQVREVMDLTGAGNNVHVIKFFHHLAQNFNEGSMPESGSPSPTSQQSDADIMFGAKK